MAFGITADAAFRSSPHLARQHELAPQLDGKCIDGLKGLIKYPLFKQRQADLVTDAARACCLPRFSAPR